MMTPETKREMWRRATEDAPTRAILWWILSECGIYTESYVGGGDTHATAFNEGRRSIGLKLLREMETQCPGSLDIMKKEATNAEKVSPRERRKAAGRSAGPDPAGTDPDAPGSDPAGTDANPAFWGDDTEA